MHARDMADRPTNDVAARREPEDDIVDRAVGEEELHRAHAAQVVGHEYAVVAVGEHRVHERRQRGGTVHPAGRLVALVLQVRINGDERARAREHLDVAIGGVLALPVVQRTELALDGGLARGIRRGLELEGLQRRIRVVDAPVREVSDLGRARGREHVALSCR